MVGAEGGEAGGRRNGVVLAVLDRDCSLSLALFGRVTAPLLVVLAKVPDFGAVSYLCALVNYRRFVGVIFIAGIFDCYLFSELDLTNFKICQIISSTKK